MKAAHLFASIVALSLVAVATSAEAHCKCKAEAFPTVLETVVVTENGAYTLAEWEARQVAREQLAATSKAYLQPVVVTPDYGIGAAERREYAHSKAQAGSLAQVSSGPLSPLQRPNLINFLRRLFN